MIIISPTRELSMQTYGVLRELMQEHSQTFGLIMGGADRKSEGAKLRKGKNFDSSVVVIYFFFFTAHL